MKSRHSGTYVLKELLVILAAIVLCLLFWPDTHKPAVHDNMLHLKINDLSHSVSYKGYQDSTDITYTDKTIKSLSDLCSHVYKSSDTVLHSTHKPYPTDVYVFEGSHFFSGDTLLATPNNLFLDTAYFNSDLNLTQCPTIARPKDSLASLSIGNTRIDGDFEFYFRKVKTDIKFDQCDFQGKVNFISFDTLQNNLSFYKCNFNKEFNGNEGSSRSNLEAAPAARLKTFRSLSFNNCAFKGNFNLLGSLFIPKAQLLIVNSIMPDTINLSGLKIDLVDFTGVRDSLGNITYLNLVGSDITRFNLEYSHFHLYFPPSTPPDQITGTYQRLLKLFKDEGFDNSYEKLDIEFKYQNAIMNNYKRNACLFVFCDNHKLGHLGDNLWTVVNFFRLPVIGYWINRTWWNFGYDRIRVLIWSLLIILLFSWFNIYIFQNLLAVFYVEKLDPSTISNVDQTNKLKLLRYWYCLIYTGFVFFKIDFDFKNMNFASRYMLILLFQYLIGLICTAFIINLILGK
ncbi:hypothetical protein ACPPVU_12580 [Mucilaginibacter sp. McL0603]|uniref:hypothetical protein n=1 Tax=Mucilaginibacter sp. McL0603 TaxID=3415670 RepID=UPI003CE8EB9A